MLSRDTFIVGASFALLASQAASAQWTHRYPQLEDFGHQIYLEQHELPVLAGGPTDPAPAPDGTRLAFAAQGWLWILDLETGLARRLTDGPGLDARPRWSPDGTRLAFVRDSSADTGVVVLDIASGRETVIDSPAIDLDPEFTADGASIYYSSGKGGSLNLYRHHIASGVETMVTDLRRVERTARRLSGDHRLVYQHGSYPQRTLRLRDFVTGEDRPVFPGGLSSRQALDTHPHEDLIAISAPIDNDYHLWTVDLNQPEIVHRITEGPRYALMPAFSADGDWIYFVEADEARRFAIQRIATHGGPAQPVAVTRWDYGVETGTLTLTLTDEEGAPLTARVSIADAQGRPVANLNGSTQFDSQTGRHYFYVEGQAALELVPGRYTVTLARGPMVPVETRSVRVRAGGRAEASATLAPLWDGRARGYAAADHHVHLNGDGQHRADHGDALRQAAGEDLDLLAPMSWNQYERRIDAALIGVTTVENGVIIAQSQEVRSNFHGHVGLIGQSDVFAPWFWGPSNPVLGNPNLTNGHVFDFAEETGAFVTYVHPLSPDDDPFGETGSLSAIPLELTTDGVLESAMGLELVCAWTSPLGNTALWYRFLNIGQPVAAMSGTDAWVDFHRTPAMGTGRTYARLGDTPVTEAAIREATLAGRSFVTTGPALEFSLSDGTQAGDITQAGTQAWQAILTSTMAVDVVEIIVNGDVIARFDGVAAGESRAYEGELTLPQGGWVAARAYASQRASDAWPTMHLRPFAHTSPIWIEEIGSTSAPARQAAAADLIRAVENARTRARIAYGDRDMSAMYTRFDAALERLSELTEPEGP